MDSKTFVGTVHHYMLDGKDRYVVDPQSIPPDIRDNLCLQQNYWLPSIIGPNHTFAHFDLNRQGWRDMRYAARKGTFGSQSIAVKDGLLHWQGSSN